MGDAFALANFAPAATTRFRLSKHGDHEFVVDGDPDTADVALMLRIEDEINQSDTATDQVAAAEEGKALLLRMVQAHQPDVVELRAGMQEILIIFALVVHGASVASAVAQAITAPAGTGTAAGEREELPHGEGEEGVEPAPATPLPSAKRSPARSSSSDETDAGLLATGTG